MKQYFYFNYIFAFFSKMFFFSKNLKNEWHHLFFGKLVFPNFALDLNLYFMKNLSKLMSIAIVVFALSCVQTKTDPAPNQPPTSNLSTNPTDCKLAKITFSDGSTPYTYKYNTDGTVSELTFGRLQLFLHILMEYFPIKKTAQWN